MAPGSETLCAATPIAARRRDAPYRPMVPFKFQDWLFHGEKCDITPVFDAFRVPAEGWLMCLEGAGMRNRGRLDANRGAHGVTRHTIHRQATSPVVRRRFRVIKVILRGFFKSFP